MARLGETGFKDPPRLAARDSARKCSIKRLRHSQRSYRRFPALIGHSVTSEKLLPTASTLGASRREHCDFGALRHQDAAGQRRWRRMVARQGAAAICSNWRICWPQVEGALTACEHEFTELTGEEVDRLRKFMNYTVDNFAEQQREKLIQYGSYAKFRSELAGADVSAPLTTCRGFLQIYHRDLKAVPRPGSRKPRRCCGDR